MIYNSRYGSYTKTIQKELSYELHAMLITIAENMIIGIFPLGY